MSDSLSSLYTSIEEVSAETQLGIQGAANMGSHFLKEILEQFKASYKLTDYSVFDDFVGFMDTGNSSFLLKYGDETTGCQK